MSIAVSLRSTVLVRNLRYSRIVGYPEVIQAWPHELTQDRISS